MKRQSSSAPSLSDIIEFHKKTLSTLPESGCDGNPGSPGEIIMLSSDNNTPNQGTDLSAGGDGSPTISLGIPGSGSNSNEGLFGKGKATVQGSLRHTFEAGGSSSGTRQAPSNIVQNHSGHLNSSSSTSLLSPPAPNPSHISFPEPPTQTPRNRAGHHPTSDPHPHLNPGAYPGWPQGNYNNTPRADLLSQQSLLFNMVASMNPPMQFDSSPHQPPSPMWLNEYPTSGMMGVPNAPRNLPPSPLTFNPNNSRADVSTERRQASDPRNFSPAIGGVGAFGGGSSAYPMEYGSGFHQWSAHHPAGLQQMVSEYPPWFLSPWDGSGSAGTQNFDFAPYPFPTSYGYFWDLLLQPRHGPINVGHNPYFPDPLISLSSGFGVPDASQTMEAQMDWGTERNSEIDRLINAAQMSFLLEFEAMHQHRLLNQFWRRRAQHRRRGMRADVDSMSYEELLALQERIGNVRTGVMERTIKRLLKRRKYQTNNTESSPNAETCCICIEEYVGGEEIGTLVCGHEFHAGCIKQWLMVKNKCPICKRNGLLP